MSLSKQDRLTLEKQLSSLQDDLVSNESTSEGVGRKEVDAAEDERVARKQFDYFNLSISSYELEIEGMLGEFITSPFNEFDVEAHASETGRMYQGTVSTSPKAIPEIYGGGISPTLRPLYETMNFIPLKDIINTILFGKLPFGSGNGTLIYPYNAGDSELKTNWNPAPGWYCIDGTSLVRISSASHVPARQATSDHCTNMLYSSPEACEAGGATWVLGSPEVKDHWVCTIAEHHALGFDHHAYEGTSVYAWFGYSNPERQFKDASTTKQSMMDESVTLLQLYIDKWLECLNKCVTGLKNNPDTNMRADEKNSILALKDYVINYRYLTELHNGHLDLFLQKVLDREAFVPVRSQHCRDDKAKYYQDRFGMCKFRCDIQTGTLTRTKFLVTIRGFFPKGGDPSIKEQIARVKNILQSG